MKVNSIFVYKIMGVNEFYLFTSCLELYFVLYLVLVVFLDLLCSLIPWGIILSLGFFISAYYFRIPRPENDALKNFLGSDTKTPERRFDENDDGKTSEMPRVTKVIAHRGCGLDAPENSLSAMRKVAEDGCNIVEFDVMLTADNIPVIFHDSSLFRLTNVAYNISELNYDQIKDLDISVKHAFGNDYQNEHIPTLQDMITTCLQINLNMFIDIKVDNPKIIQIILELFQIYPEMYNVAVVTSFNPILIYQIRSRNPKITCSLAWRPKYYSYNDYSGSEGGIDARTSNIFGLWLRLLMDVVHKWFFDHIFYHVLGLSAVLLHKDMVNREVLSYWKKRNVHVIPWSVNLPSEKQYFERVLGVTYMTDTLINT